jgi:acyl-coenzyme A thioesterase PaaI-like protein
VARAKILKLGRRLAVGTIEIQSEGEEDLVAHASGTYALPAHR